MADSQSDKPDLKTLPGRLVEARLRAAVVAGYTVSRAKMAELVGRIVGRDLDEKQWRRWENGEAEPKLDVIQAAARVSELSPEYIAFGKKTAQGRPVSDGLELHDATQEAADAGREHRGTAKGK